MFGFIGKKLCLELVIVSFYFDKYILVSKEVREIFVIFDFNYCIVSLDEVYLDFIDYMIKRSGLSEKERIVICRNCDSFDKSFCLCDLNEILGFSVCENGIFMVKDRLLDVCGACGKFIFGFEFVIF